MGERRAALRSAGGPENLTLTSNKNPFHRRQRKHYENVDGSAPRSHLPSPYISVYFSSTRRLLSLSLPLPTFPSHPLRPSFSLLAPQNPLCRSRPQTAKLGLKGTFFFPQSTGSNPSPLPLPSPCVVPLPARPAHLPGGPAKQLHQ